jgi:hypothetical protein
VPDIPPATIKKWDKKYGRLKSLQIQSWVIQMMIELLQRGYFHCPACGVKIHAGSYDQMAATSHDPGCWLAGEL